MALPQEFIDLCASESVATERAARDFHAMAAALNAPTERGPVPLEVFAAECLQLNLTGGVLALLELPIGTELAPGVTMGITTKGLLHQVITLVQSDLRLVNADVDDPKFGPACDGLIALGVIDAAGKASLLALGNNRRGKAAVILGRDCTAVDCWEACGGDS